MSKANFPSSFGFAPVFLSLSLLLPLVFFVRDLPSFIPLAFYLLLPLPSPFRPLPPRLPLDFFCFKICVIKVVPDDCLRTESHKLMLLCSTHFSEKFEGSELSQVCFSFDGITGGLLFCKICLHSQILWLNIRWKTLQSPLPLNQVCRETAGIPNC